MDLLAKPEDDAGVLGFGIGLRAPFKKAVF